MKAPKRPALPALLLALAASAFAESGPQFRDTKSQSLGRTGTASSKGATALFMNPAALARETGGSMGLSMDLGLNPVLLDYAEWAKDNYQYLDSTEALLERIEPVDNKWAPFSQSLLLYGNWEGVGFSILSDTRYELTVGKAVVTPVPGVGARSDLVLTAGRGFRADEGYRFGFALKYLYRLIYDPRLVGTTDEDFYKVKQAWEKPGKGIWDDLAKLKVAADIAETKQGVGVNLGAEKDIDSSFTAGLALIDFPTILDQEFTRPDINLGLSWHPRIDWLADLDDRVVVNLDWHRFLIPGTPWFKHIKAGAAFEGWMNNRPVAYLGLGLNDGYPTFGMRFGYIVYLSYVYVAEEVGTYPGQEKLAFHKLILQAEF